MTRKVALRPVVADNDNMGSSVGGGVRASMSSSTTAVSSGSNPVILPTSAEMSQLPRHHSLIPSSTATATPTQGQASLIRPLSPVFLSAERQRLPNRDARDRGYGEV